MFLFHLWWLDNRYALYASTDSSLPLVRQLDHLRVYRESLVNRLAVGAGSSARSARKITTIRHAFALRMLNLMIFFFCKLPLSVRNLDCRAQRRIRVGAGEELIHQQDHRFRGGQGDGGLGPFGCRCTTRTLLAEVHVCAD